MLFFYGGGVIAFLFLSCMSELKEKDSTVEKNGFIVSLSFANDGVRTLSPASGVSYKDVKEWTITVHETSEKYADKEYSVNGAEESFTFTLFPGTFLVSCEGTTGDDSDDICFYGDTTVTFTEADSPVKASIFVAPKKTVGGTGSFSYTLSITGADVSESAAENVTASLVPWNGGRESVTLVQSSGENGSIIFSKDGISSGFYTLEVFYKETEKLNCGDFLVEIIDGKKTSGAATADIQSLFTRTYYASVDNTKMGNGQFSFAPRYFDTIMNDLSESSILKSVNIYMTDGEPEIDVAKIKPGVTYTIYDKSSSGKKYYTLESDKITVKNAASLALADSSKEAKEIPLYFSDEVSYGNGKEFSVSLKNNVSISILKEVDSSPNFYPIVNMTLTGIDEDASYKENPFITVSDDFTGSVHVSLGLDEAISTRIIIEESSKVEETGDSIVKYFLVPTDSLNGGITGVTFEPLLAKVIAGEAEKDFPEDNTVILEANSTLSFTATVTQNSQAQIPVTYNWFVNNTRVENADDAFSVDCATDSNIVYNKLTTVMCVIAYKGKYSSQSITFNVVEQTPIVLYNKFTDGANGTDNSKIGFITDASNQAAYSDFELGGGKLVDFCFGADNSLYVVQSSGEATSVSYALNSYTWNGSEFQSGTSSDITGTGGSTIEVAAVEVDPVTDACYIMDKSSSANQYRNTIYKPDETSVFTGFRSSDVIETFCVYNGILYVVELAEVADTEGETDIKKVLFSVNINSSDETKIQVLSAANLGITDASNLVYKDMYYSDGYLYLIARDVIHNTNSGVRSRGAIITVNVIDSEKPTIVSVAGYANDVLEATDSNENYNYRNTDHSEINFYGPTKIIAIKDDELLIADDGFCIVNGKPRSVTDGESSGVQNVNRIVAYNTASNTIAPVVYTVLENEIEFENTYDYFSFSNF